MAHQIDEYIEKDMYLNYIDIFKEAHSIFKRNKRYTVSCPIRVLAVFIANFKFLTGKQNFDDELFECKYSNINKHISIE